MAACLEAAGVAAGERAVVELEAEETRLLEAADCAEFPWQVKHGGSALAFLNHGGCSGPCLGALRLRRKIDEMANRQPMEWHRDVVPALLGRARQAACDFVGVQDVERFFFTSNVSVGLFAVLKAVRLAPGDVVVTTSVRYHSIHDALEDLCRRSRARLYVVEIPLPVRGGLLETWEAGLDAATRVGPVKLAVYDHVSSKPAVLFPAKAMARACRRRGVPSLVDGAHAPGSIKEADLSLDDVGADYYCVNFHKWFYAPRPSGALVVDDAAADRYDWIDGSVLHVGRAAREHASPAAYRVDDLVQGVYDEATKDYANYVVLPLCVKIARRMELKTLDHRHAVLPRALALDAAFNGTPGRPIAAPDFCVSMANVFLPARLVELAPKTLDTLDAKLKWLKTHVHDHLWVNHRVEVPVFVLDGHLALRISLPLYVGQTELDLLARAVRDLMPPDPA